jgi:hypothetical protein
MLRAAGGKTKKEWDAEAAPPPPPPPPRPAPSEPGARVVPPARPAGQKAGGEFFRNVNRAALDNLDRWVSRLFPKARRSGESWRVSSADLGRGYEEDLSFHRDGVRDFGAEGSLSPVDALLRWGGAPDATKAAFTLCEWLGREPSDLGWKNTGKAGGGAPPPPPPDEGDGEGEGPEPEPGPGRGDPVARFFADFNRRYFVVQEYGKVLIYVPRYDEDLNRTYYDRMSFADFKNAHCNKYVTVGVDKDGKPDRREAGKFWLKHSARRSYLGGVVFDPSNRPVPRDVFNLWQGFAVQPKEGDWSKLRDHILNVICRGNLTWFDFLMDWMAFAVQNPHKQAQVIVVLRGPEGSGKGILARSLKYLFGQHGLTITNASHLTGKFNAHLRDTVFLFADEAFFAGDRAHVGVLKGLTEPELTIEFKAGAVVQVTNYLHPMMASNEEWVVPASLKSRRWCIFDVTETESQNHVYFAAIQKQMDEGGHAAMLFELLARDISRSNLRKAPDTDALQQQRKLSLDTTERWWHDCLHKGFVFQSRYGLEDHFEAWHDWLATSILFASYTAFADKFRERRPLSREALGTWMGKAGAKPVRPRGVHVTGEHMVDGIVEGRRVRTARLIEKDRPPGYSLGTLDAAREDFRTFTGLTIDWGTYEDEAEEG